MGRLLILVFLLLPTGCQRARSFLQMDSNSRSPFLGLSLSVDARDTQTPLPDGREPADLATTASTSSSETSSTVTVSRTDLAAMDADEELIRTAKTQRRQSNLKYSLPLLNPDRHSGEAAEVEEIISRISG
jgi:hypothetical protein